MKVPRTLPAASPRAGFTLMELLITIGIIGVLSSLVFAGAKMAGDYSKRAGCLSNLRQWGTALQLYVPEHNGDLPRRGQGVQMVGQFNRPEDWFNALPSYMGMDSLLEMRKKGTEPKPGQRSVFVCPAADKFQPGSKTFLSYGMNMYLSQWNQPTPDNLFQLDNPAQLAFMADSPGGYASTIPSASGYSVPARHGGSACVVFCDGHAACLKGDYLGCGKGPLVHDDVRWEVVPGSNTNSPVK